MHVVTYDSIYLEKNIIVYETSFSENWEVKNLLLSKFGIGPSMV